MMNSFTKTCMEINIPKHYEVQYKIITTNSITTSPATTTSATTYYSYLSTLIYLDRLYLSKANIYVLFPITFT